jgi:hypothetical protein
MKHPKCQLLKKELGNPLTTGEVASYLGIDEGTVRRYYLELGGTRIGKKKFIFFERRLINAVLRQEEETMGCPCDEEEQEEAGFVHDNEGGKKVRGEVSEHVDRELEQEVRTDLFGDMGS